MKKFFALLLCLLMVLSMAACTNNDVEEPSTDAPATDAPTDEPTDAPTDEPTDAPAADVDLDAIAAVLYEGINPDDMPMMGTIPVEADAFEYYAFIPYIDGAQAVASEPMMGSIAHSVVLINLPEGSDVEAVKADIEANADPRKWICVEAEQVTVVNHGNVVMLVMSTADMTQSVLANFEAYWG